ncbi:hypothetical protein AwPolaro_06310 [Polaromonas sp.]|nr:hypothetical protein AwPolaro_06310 [Polaromonas sp.]
MKTPTVVRNGVSPEMVDLVGRLIKLISWPARRQAMGDVTLALLDGKPRVAESVFGWSRSGVEMGIHEHRTGIACINDLSARVSPKTEDKHPELLAEIQAIMVPKNNAEPSLRSSISAKKLRETLLQNGWSEQSLPTERTLSNLLNRQDYRARSVLKTKAKTKKPRAKPTPPPQHKDLAYQK